MHHHNSPIEVVLSAISKTTGKQPVGSGKDCKISCPAHEDKNPSLSVTEGDDGRVLLKCWAGCSFEEILNAAGLKKSDLFPRPDRNSSAKIFGNPDRPNEKQQKAGWPTSSALIENLEKKRGPRSAAWTYRDRDDHEVGGVIRWDRDDGKDIRPIHRNEAGWCVGAMPEPRPPYRLRDILNAEVVFVFEGEKAVDAAVSIGLNATTSCGGSNAAEKTDWSPLAGKVVVIIRDNDEPGRKFAETVASILLRLDASTVVRIIDLADDWPELPGKGDLADWLEAHDAVEPEVLRNRIKALVTASEIWGAPHVYAEPLDNSGTTDGYPEKISMRAFHGLACKFVSLVSSETEADEVALLMHFLTIFSGMAGRERYYPVSGTCHHARLFSVAVGGTASGRKGTALDCVLHVLRMVDEGFCEDNIVSGLTSGAGLLWHVRDPKEGDDDGGVIDKRLVVIESEFGGVLRASNRRENDLSPVLRDSWDGKSLRSLAKQQPARATDPHINVCGHITREELRETISKNDIGNGMANRILWYGSKRSQLLPDGGDLHQVDFREVVAEIRAAVQFARFPGRMTRSEAARSLWHDVYSRLTAPRPGAFGKATTRAEAQVLRLSMIFALLDRSDEIDLPHLEAALAVWDHAEDSARWVFGNSTGNVVADRILEALRESGPLGLSEISSLFSGNKPREELQVALTTLAELGLAQRCKPEGTGRGRPPELWSAK
ncbi:MAG: hypothetical protein O2820_10250 [Planctomycetota bacterium]|nr:hypothetical protein [Planctomycetota bacterium]MDA1249593.1 hypothetical protein [Planctomycetota bacterium]